MEKSAADGETSEKVTDLWSRASTDFRQIYMLQYCILSNSLDYNSSVALFIYKIVVLKSKEKYKLPSFRSYSHKSS
jgi:hypothetical protein